MKYNSETNFYGVWKDYLYSLRINKQQNYIKYKTKKIKHILDINQIIYKQLTAGWISNIPVIN